MQTLSESAIAPRATAAINANLRQGIAALRLQIAVAVVEVEAAEAAEHAAARARAEREQALAAANLRRRTVRAEYAVAMGAS